MKVTLQQIADKAGLSRSGVSRALRNEPTIPKETRLRVQGIARLLHYKPNPYISTLMSNLRGSRLERDQAVLGYVTNFKPQDDWHQITCQRRFYEGAVNRANALGYSVEEFKRAEPRMTSSRLNRILRARSVRGLIIAPMPFYRSHFTFDWSFFTSITMDYSLWRPRMARCCTNQLHCIAEAIRHLRHLGYTKIGLAVNQENDDRVSRQWSAGYLSRLRAPNEINSPLLIASRWNERVFIDWLMTATPDVVISPHIEALTWMRQGGIRVPEDVGFVCLDWSKAISDCAGVNQNCELVGEKAVDILVSSIQRNEFGIPENPMTHLIEGRWIGGPTIRNTRLQVKGYPTPFRENN